MNENIVLIGFMGSGKTTVGLNLAKRTGRRLVETDAEIEKSLGKKIAEIFSEHGEGFFRDAESLVCEAVSKERCCVISTGGGVIKRAENIERLRQNGVIFYLRASPLHLYNNLKNDTTRPLLAGLKNNEKYKEIERILCERSEVYAGFADKIIDVTGKAPDKIVNEILLNTNVGGNQ